MRNGTRIWMVGVLLALTAGLATAAAAKKPPPDPVDTGTIYYGTTGGLHEMEPDGSGKTPLDLGYTGAPEWHGPSVVPSHALHGQERWFLLFLPESDDAYPNGYPRYELYAVSESGALVQLTDGETNDANGARVEIVEPNSYSGMDSDARADHSWVTDESAVDGKISYLAKTWAKDAAGDWYVKDYGIFVLRVDPDDLESYSPVVPERLPLDVDTNPSGCIICKHSWSPDGTALVYHRRGSYLGIWRANCVNGSWSTEWILSDTASQPEWSPDPDDPKILFLSGGNIESMSTSGTGRTTVLSPGRGQSFPCAYWSANGTHIVYQVQKVGKWMNVDSDVYRAAADGSEATNLTRDTSDYCVPIAWEN